MDRPLLQTELRMTGHPVGSAALDSFTSTKVSDEVAIPPGASGDVFCAVACRYARPSIANFARCNSFVVDAGVCKLGFATGTWMLQNVDPLGTAGKIFSEILL